MVLAIRVIVGAFGAFLFCVGLLLIGGGGPAAPAGITPLIIGGVALIAVVLERTRYRSQATDGGPERAGPGGGEPDGLPSQFKPTDERFIDPTSNRVMRVFVDPGTGERRYRAES